jgi:putative methyltransferase (TIGR04325 family)
MGLKEIATEISATPPIRSVVAGLGRTGLGRRFLSGLAPYRGVYPTLEEAWKAAGKRRHAGHEHPEAIERHAVLSDALMPSDYAVLYWLGRLSGNIRVFDFGGNMGNVFYSYARYMDLSRVSWRVYDLEKVVEAGRTLAKERSGPKPEFSTSTADARDSNFLLVSGSYHYWEKSTEQFLDQFPRLPEHVIINRSPFYKEDREPVIAMQSTLNFAFPIVIRPVKELLGGFAARGYQMVDQWTAAEYGHVMPFFPEQSVRRYSGFYFQLRNKSDSQRP